MDSKIILDTFYNYVIPGVLQGEVDCDYLLHILFNVSIQGRTLEASNKFNIESIPTLYISNINEFNNVFVRYVTIAMEFYKDKLKYISDDKKIAYIETLAFVPMGQKDYLNPIEYLNKLTTCMEVTPFDLTDDFKDYGNVPTLDSHISIKIDKETPNEEAPYKFMIKLQNDSETYSLQTIRFYIYNDVVCIGAIQHEQKREISEKSKIKRKLFKANENADMNSDMMNVNPGGVVAMSVFVSYMESLGYKKFKALPVNVQRGIDKKILAHNLNELLEVSPPPEERRHKVVATIERANGYSTKSGEIRKQLKHAFVRVAHHFDVIDLFDESEDETAIVCENIIGCNNKLLGEVYTTISEEQKKLT